MNHIPIRNYILCCDWGTSSLRLRLVDSRSYEVIHEIQSAEGVAGTFKAWQEQKLVDRFDFFAGKLKAKMNELAKMAGLELDRVPIVVSGMASSSIGMEEVPYANLPFATDGKQASLKVFQDLSVLTNSLILVSGVSGDNDVMRGEEVQLIGLLHLKEPGLENMNEAVFIFPGTHSKHIFVKDGFVNDFQTFMTGEIFNLLHEHSILKDSIAQNAASGLSDPANEAAFKSGMEVSGFAPFLNSLFSVRTNQLFNKLTREENFFYLSGLLIGTETRNLLEQKGHLIVCSGKNLFGHYKLAFEMLGLTNVTFIPSDLVDKATIAGQVQIFKTLKPIFNE